MEAALGLPAGSLESTMHTYNKNATAGEDPDFHKHADWLQPLDAPPYAAFDASRGRAGFVGFTVGGLCTTIDGHVRSDRGEVIAGLFAAGACASNIVQDSEGYNSGICLGEAAYFGRRAGRAAARG
jgi:succinate dehydrogenase/fumarate reductase flavoprotein subunit